MKFKRVLGTLCLISLMLLTSCDKPDLISTYYVNGNSDNFKKSIDNKIFKNVTLDIPKYYTEYYEVNIEIIKILKTVKSSELKEVLIVSKYNTDDDQIGYCYDLWTLSEDNEIVDFKNIWTDN